MKKARRIASVALVLLLAAGTSSAAGYPAKPLRLVVPFPPGGAADIVARGLAPGLGGRLGQQIVVDNRPGANGVIGFDIVAKAPADGHTLLLAFTTGVAVNPLLVARIPYSVKDFAPVGMLARTPMVLVAAPAFQARSVKELIALAKAAPGKIAYGSPGTGNPNHLAGELFKSAASVDLVHVPYKGAALVITDVIAGHVPVAFVTLAAALPQVRAGKLRALATTGEGPAAAAPDIPTMTAAGVPGVEISEWFGILVPAGTPGAVISRLNGEMVKAVRSTELGERFLAQGLDPAPTSVEEFAAVIRSDVEKSARIIAQAGIRAD